MKKSLLAAAITVLLATGTAGATTMIAGPVIVPPDTLLRCSIWHGNKKPLKNLEIRARIDLNGSSTFNLDTFEPDDFGQIMHRNQNESAFREGVCVFKFRGSKKGVRAAACSMEFPNCGTRAQAE